jgi:peroxiredoxin
MIVLRTFQARACSIGPERATRLGLAVGLALGAMLSWTAVRGESAKPYGTALIEFAATATAPLALPDLEGTTHDLAAYRGQVVVVNFWATWCAPCLAEMAVFERAQRERWPSGVRLLAVNAGDPEESVRRFVARAGVSFPILLDRNSTTSRAWQVTALPITYVIGPDGALKAGAVGARDWDHPEIAAALAGWQKNGG